MRTLDYAKRSAAAWNGPVRALVAAQVGEPRKPLAAPRRITCKRLLPRVNPHVRGQIRSARKGFACAAR